MERLFKLLIKGMLTSLLVAVVGFLILICVFLGGFGHGSDKLFAAVFVIMVAAAKLTVLLLVASGFVVFFVKDTSEPVRSEGMGERSP